MTASKRILIAPAFRRLPPPILIVGMHRSGTSLVAGMLSLLGVYIDPTLSLAALETPGRHPDSNLRRDGYGEAQAFRLLNEAVMRPSGAIWSNITPFLKRRDSPFYARRSLLRMQLATLGSLSRDYLRQMPPANRGLWGWKDPRTSLTLPYWLRLFPDARILHTRRDPDAVVRSLLRRAGDNQSEAAAVPSLSTRLLNAASHPDVALRALGRRCGIITASAENWSAPQDREGWLHLTTQYVEECLKYRGHLGGYLELSYEEVLADPASAAYAFAEFAGVRSSPDLIQRAAAIVTVNS